MKRTPEKVIVWDDTRGGRNDTDPPLSLRDDQCVELLNVDWKDTTFARKRGGATSVSLTGGTSFGAIVVLIGKFLPAGGELLAELWGWDSDGSPLKRLAGGTSWADVTLDDAIESSVGFVEAVSFNGKFFIAYDSAQDRMHVYDPQLASPRVRRMGFVDPTTGPTVADTGAGAYAATLRYYRIRWAQINGSGTFVRVSEPSASQSFTPSGAGTAARVTRPTAAGEGETHWRVEVSLDNATFFVLADVAIATTTYDDSAATTTYSSGALSEQIGFYMPFPSVRFLVTDGNRILGASTYESAGANSGGRSSRVWFTPVLGSADKGDDERLVNTSTQKNWVDLNENDGGNITGLGGPLNGVIYAFKWKQVWALRPTGDVTAPYLVRRLRDDIGCVNAKTIQIGEDQIGRAALYFMSHRGPYRIRYDGVIEYLGRDNEVTWRSFNLAASIVRSVAVYYPELHQWWLWIATGSSNVPDIKMVFDVQKGYPDENGAIRGGWVKHTGASADVVSAVLFANTLGATMSRDLKPYVGVTASTAVLKCDTSDLDDAGTDFQAYVKSKPTQTAMDLRQRWGLAEPVMLAKALTGVTLTLTSDRDFGAETRTHTQLLTASGTEARVCKVFEGAEVGEAHAIQLQIGDGAAQEGAWSIDAITIPALPQEAKS